MPPTPVENTKREKANSLEHVLRQRAHAPVAQLVLLVGGKVAERLQQVGQAERRQSQLTRRLRSKHTQDKKKTGKFIQAQQHGRTVWGYSMRASLNNVKPQDNRKIKVSGLPKSRPRRIRHYLADVD